MFLIERARLGKLVGEDQTGNIETISSNPGTGSVIELGFIYLALSLAWQRPILCCLL